MGPGDLHQVISSLHLMPDPNIIVGVTSFDDAGVYRLTDDLAIVQTIDIVTPVVDDPYLFGQIAAANALSDVYAMGGRPVTAMNVVCFPVGSLELSVLQDILRGGLDKMQEAGVALVGGHSVDDQELKYGFSVTGVIHPREIVTSADARAGDKLLLTKPLGIGLITTALKRGRAAEATIAKATEQMVALNQKASELMRRAGAHACTDITGFGLLGHACQMAQNSGVGLRIHFTSIPLLPEAEALAKAGMSPGGCSRNRNYYLDNVEAADAIPDFALDILFDPQTSGGLLISVPPQEAEGLLLQLHRAGVGEAAIIGEVVAEPKGKIILD